MEKEQFVQLIPEAEPTLFHIAYSILHDEQDCADAVSEAVVKRCYLRGYFRAK